MAIRIGNNLNKNADINKLNVFSMIRVITVRLVNPQQILTTVMTRIVVDRSTDQAKPHSIC